MRATVYRRSVRPRPVLSLAHQAAERAAFQTHRVRALFHKIAAKDLAFLGTVYLSRPLIGAVRLHAEDDLNSDQRPAALGRVGVVLVELRLSGLGVVQLLEPDDVPAQRAAAVLDLD